MRILGLDLSLSTGWAVLEDGILVDCGQIECVRANDGPIEDFNMLKQSRLMALAIATVLDRFQSDYVYIEQTNAGRFRSSQRQLEWVHYAVLELLEGRGLADKVRYVDTSQWRSVLKIKLTKEQKKHNKQLSELKKSGKIKKAKKGQGKVGWKALAIQWTNEKFGLELMAKQDDVADALCIASYGILKENDIKNIPKIDLDKELLK